MVKICLISILGEFMFLNWAFLFLILAIIAAAFGFGGIAAESAWIAKVLFVVFLVVFVVSFFLNRAP
jgi:uncharacterized membrane protein YtjA (UPF0391 family)